jgi:hypothetical protein
LTDVSDELTAFIISITLMMKIVCLSETSVNIRLHGAATHETAYFLSMLVIWVVTPRDLEVKNVSGELLPPSSGLKKRRQFFPSKCSYLLTSPHSDTTQRNKIAVMVEAVSTSETPVDFFETQWRKVFDDRPLHSGAVTYDLVTYHRIRQ